MAYEIWHMPYEIWAFEYTAIYFPDCLIKQSRLERFHPQDFAHGAITSAVNRRCAEPPQRFEVSPRWIAFVGGEAVAGVSRVEFDHHRVTRRFSDDRGGGDARRERVAVNDAALRAGA